MKTPARWAVASLSLSMLLSSLGTSIANVALPTLAKTFDASFQQVQWIVLAYLLASTTLIVSAGRLGDITGRRRLLLGGIWLFTLASIGCGAASTLWLLIAARAAQGLGAAIMMALTVAFVGETVPKARTGTAMGLLGTTSAIGTALGPSLGGVLIAGLGWQAIFLINVPLGLVTFALAYRYLPTDKDVSKSDRGGFDEVRTLLFAGSGLSASLATSALVSTVMMATLVVGPFYLSRGLGLEASSFGIVLSVGPLVAALTGVPSGRIADGFGPRRTTIVGLIGMAVGCFLLSMMPTTFGVPGYIIPIAVITVGYALFQTGNNTAVMADVLPNQRGVVSGLLQLSRNLGLITGASLMSTVFALASATSDVATAGAEAVTKGMRVTFLFAAALIAAGLAIAVGSAKRNEWKFIS